MIQCPIYMSTLGLQTNNKVHVKPYNIQIHNYVAQDSPRVVTK